MPALCYKNVVSVSVIHQLFRVRVTFVVASIIFSSRRAVDHGLAAAIAID